MEFNEEIFEWSLKFKMDSIYSVPSALKLAQDIMVDSWLAYHKVTSINIDEIPLDEEGNRAEFTVTALVSVVKEK